MFPWRNFAKSAEATFSRWALKRVCKFFLKKKLGQFILGDLDLDQLDVQLSEGTIQLSDLALNVDFVNTKFGKKSSIMIKEGSIGYLLIKMPWSGKGCEVEVNGLELVVSPCLDKVSTSEDDTCGMDNSDNHRYGYSSTRTEHGISDDAEKLASMDVHEGVKTIAKMIKWLLTSFHVTVTNVIVAFDPSVDNVENKTHCHHTLVLQISEIQCGTSLSEDADLNVDVLGISQLTNFVKFHGAVIELLQIDNEDFYFHHESSAGCDEPVLGSNIATCPVMTGNKGGFSGSIKLSIPWKNGSLDICKVDAVAHVDPIVLRFQPSSIKWLLQAWETLKNLNKNGKGCTNHNVRGSAQLNSTLLRHSSTSVSISSASSEIITADGSLSVEYASLIQPETLAEDLLPAANVISDWVPLSTHTSHNKDGIQELDFGASVDQFFECFDGMRNSQSALGNSGMWNWTYSVFSAITAASSLASGSLHIPSEQQHMETNFSATFAGVSVVLSCCVDEQKKFSDTEIGHKDGLQIDYLGAECNDIVLALQVCPQGMTLDAKVSHIEVANFCNIGVDGKNQTALVQHLQAKVLDALPSSTCYNIDSHSLIGSVATDFPFGNNDCLLKVTLFRTSGVMNCKFSVQSSSSDGCLIGSTSFSLSLPPFSFWVIFSVINVLMNLLKEVEKSLGMHNKEKEILSEALDNKCGPSQSNMKEGSSPCVRSFSPTQCLHGDISISNARVILCFPFERDGDHNNSFPWEQFIALDFTSSSPLNNGCTPIYSQSSNASSKKRFPSVSAQSLQLSFCDLDIYLITSSNENGGIISYDVQNEKFSASCFFSIFHRRGRFSVFRVVLQGGKVTGPWIAKKARLFANSEQTRGKEDTGRKGHEFVSVSTVKDLEEWKAQTQQEMILSSSFLIHVHLSQLVINMNYSQYKGIHHLLHQTLNALTCVASKEANVEKESSVSQSSVFMECDSLEILIDRDTSESTKSSIKSELPGIWCQFRLKVQQFEVLSVTNTGGIKAASFFRLAHGEGKLWGFVTGLPDHEFLLITCSNSVVKRGDGGGSNTLSSKCAGSEVICLSDPEISVAVTSITVSCGIPLDGSLIEVGQMNLHKPEVLSHELTLTEPVSVRGPEELSLGIHCDELSRHKLRNVEHKEIERGSGRWYGGTSLKVLENHIAEEIKQPGMKKAVDHQGMLSSDDSSTHGETCGRVILKEIDIRWRMYSGSDWLDSEKSGQHSGRDTSICLELALSGMKFQYDIYPVGGLHVSKMSVSVKDFYLYDRSHDAPWKLVLGYYQSKRHPRESFSKAFKLDLDAVRPDPLTPLEEYRLNVTILPLLLHLHQRQLDFFVDFFGRKNTLKGQFPNSSQDLEGSKSLPEKTKKDKDHVFHSVAPEALLPYFQKLDIWPILVRVDYSPTHVDLAALRNGKYVELVNLVPWKGIELNLKHVHASGVYGWASVCETTVGDWLEDISQNQIHKILRGLPTVRSLIAVGAGAAKLVSSPVESYKKERRVLKGVQRGTIAFLRSISLEAVGLGVHLAAGAHDILLQAEYILSSIPSPVPLPVKDKLKTDVRSNQPKDAQEGIQQAYESLSDGLGKSAAVLVQSPLKKFQRGSGAGPALAAAVRAVPAAAIAPASACASAVHCALLGFRNSLDPERKKESMEKYCPAQPWEED
ncbi:autophagy-related protein 2 isoform X7 [Vigna angularis]|uniref:autophagy-related protein 2 isoform X7 n=1 Tax=Phaseolus angularis TaxID=3914 RepID=UPI0022B3F74E|nr:autophagy-related protein 2 isoform X7 [Vigna angularis]